MQTTIRTLTDRDRAQWEPLWQGYLAFYETALPPAVTDATWGKLMAPGADGPFAFAAERDGRLIGVVHYHFHGTTWTVGPYCYLQDLFVDPAARTAGAGRALIEAVYGAARARGASQVYWLTQHFNATARRLYDQVAAETPFIKYVKRL